MRLLIVLLTLILFTNSKITFSQNKELFVVYDMCINSETEIIELRANWKASMSHTIMQIQEWGGFPAITYCPSVYKDYSTMKMYWEEYQGQLLIEDDMSGYVWTILNEQKEIMGFSCTKATGKFFGREYIAWFTMELPYKAAPWRFNGLPGVLLEIKSKDEYVDVMAKSVEVRDAKKLIINPFKKERSITRDEFVKIFISRQKKLNEELKAVSAQSNINIRRILNLRVDKIEVR
jgi:GLPGLI family protein